MINILSIRCSLAFSPYLVESATAFLSEGAVTSRVVRQGSSGLIIRSDGDIVLRHQNRQVYLGLEEAKHYLAAMTFRSDYYRVARMEDEVVLANVGSELFLSHPQSDLWLGPQSVEALLRVFIDGGLNPPPGLPEWLTVSTGGGRLLISDQRNGRWVLLGEDHIREIQRRLALLEPSNRAVLVERAPTISLKGVTVHLQSAQRLAEVLEDFGESGRFESFADRTPEFSLTAKEGTEGIEITDETMRIGLTAKEGRKWAAIIRSELARLNSSCITRGKIRTVFADHDGGRWVLQWGDEVFVSAQTSLPAGASVPNDQGLSGQRSPRFQEAVEIGRIDEFVLLLSGANGNCVALDPNELVRLSE